MPTFEIDLPTAQAKRFDLEFERFVIAKLICRSDVDVRTTRYSKGDGIERRAVFMSSREHFEDFRGRWRASRTPTSNEVGRAEARPGVNY